MNIVRTLGFVEISSSANRKIVWYYARNIGGVVNYIDLIHSLEPELNQLLKTRVQQGAIKFNLKLEATYNRPNVVNSSENRAFKTSAVKMFAESNISEIIKRAFVNLLNEKNEYTGRGSGFTMESIDGLLLSIYKYTPMYIQLPKFIEWKRATINPQNIDQQCFKWAILAKHVTGSAICRIGENYKQYESMYNFEGITFPTPISDIYKFEKNNSKVSVNVYGLEKKFQPPRKYPTYEVYPLRVVDEEKANHFDLLLVKDKDNPHYVYISNFSRLIRAQKTRHTERVVFCKRCFTSFDSRSHTNIIIR